VGIEFSWEKERESVNEEIRNYSGLSQGMT
jgi:hypothetical protein